MATNKKKPQVDPVPKPPKKKPPTAGGEPIPDEVPAPKKGKAPVKAQADKPTTQPQTQDIGHQTRITGNPRGQPMKLNAEVIKTISNALKLGSNYKMACAKARIDYTTFRNWYVTGKYELLRLEADPDAEPDPAKENYVNLFYAVNDAKAELHLNAKATIFEAGILRKDPVWAAHILAKAWPDSDGPKPIVEDIDPQVPTTQEEPKPIVVEHKFKLEDADLTRIGDILNVLASVGAFAAAGGAITDAGAADTPSDEIYPPQADS